jgi:hypothetical protein
MSFLKPVGFNAELVVGDNNAKEARAIGTTAMDGGNGKCKIYHDRMVLQLRPQQDDVVTRRNYYHDDHNDDERGLDVTDFPSVTKKLTKDGAANPAMCTFQEVITNWNRAHKLLAAQRIWRKVCDKVTGIRNAIVRHFAETLCLRGFGGGNLSYGVVERRDKGMPKQSKDDLYIYIWQILPVQDQTSLHRFSGTRSTKRWLSKTNGTPVKKNVWSVQQR